MSKIVDPIIDYFLQIPLAEGNILQFLSHHGFQVSKVQNPDGSTHSILFYNVSFPAKTVQFTDEENGVENFLYPFQQNLFFILDTNEMTFIIKSPREEKGIAIERGGENMQFIARKVKYTGEPSNTLDDEIENKTSLHITKTGNQFTIPHSVLQKIFTTFIVNKQFPNIEALMQEYRNTSATPTDDAYSF